MAFLFMLLVLILIPCYLMPLFEKWPPTDTQDRTLKASWSRSRDRRTTVNLREPRRHRIRSSNQALILYDPRTPLDRLMSRNLVQPTSTHQQPCPPLNSAHLLHVMLSQLECSRIFTLGLNVEQALNIKIVCLKYVFEVSKDIARRLSYGPDDLWLFFSLHESDDEIPLNTSEDTPTIAMLEGGHGLESVDENSGEASSGTEEDDSSSTDAGASDGESTATSATSGGIEASSDNQDMGVRDSLTSNIDTAASSTASTAGVKRSREADDICSTPAPKAIRRCRSHDVKGHSEPGVVESVSASTSTSTKRRADDVDLCRSLHVEKLGRNSKLHDVHGLTLRDRKRKADPDDEKFSVHSTKSRKVSKSDCARHLNIHRSRFTFVSPAEDLNRALHSAFAPSTTSVEPANANMDIRRPKSRRQRRRTLISRIEDLDWSILCPLLENFKHI